MTHLAISPVQHDLALALARSSLDFGLALVASLELIPATTPGAQQLIDEIKLSCLDFASLAGRASTILDPKGTANVH